MLRDFLKGDWCSLNWTKWIKFSEAKANRDKIPKVPGMYRIKPVGTDQIIYIGQTGRDLRERLIGHLVTHTLRDEMPFNDPHTAGPSLWAWANANGWEYEFSVAPINLDKPRREGFECYLLWQYRVENGESTYCNHGRFHKDYIKSKARSSRFRGYKLEETHPRNDAWGNSFPPLKLIGIPTKSNFMELNWSTPQELNSMGLKDVPSNQGVYKIFEEDSKDLLYIGQSTKLLSRLKSHSRKKWGKNKIYFSISHFPYIKEYQLKEVENDIIGGYYLMMDKVPLYQFKNNK